MATRTGKPAPLPTKSGVGKAEGDHLIDEFRLAVKGCDPVVQMQTAFQKVVAD